MRPPVFHAATACDNAILVPMPAPHLDKVVLRQDAVLSRDSIVVKKPYRFSSKDESGKSAAIYVRGHQITIDFRGATIQGSTLSTDPDERKGTGLLVEGNDVTIKNLKIRGFKIGMLANKCKGLRLIDCDFSYNWKQRLQSTPEKESEADWMSFHHNENNEWLRYGAGAYLQDCEKFEVKNLSVTGGQCGLMLNRCNNGLVWNSDLSFNSAIGLGLYRSSGNRFMHNKMDWCVRGYSHGVYNRGQDSSGILVFEQCQKNLFAFNSATHGGDGFFLWAGQHTMDTGEGGCNDNLLYGNDFSHSPCNAIEATFSRNVFTNNLLIDSWHGLWGGYSYDSLVSKNIFGLNGESIAIEHGQNNKIIENRFVEDTVSVYLWQNDRAPDPNWGYPKKRDTTNKGTVIFDNSLENCTEMALEFGTSLNIDVVRNSILNCKSGVSLRGQQKGVRFADNRFQTVDDMPNLDAHGLINSYEKIAGQPVQIHKTRGGSSILPESSELPKKAQGLVKGWLPTEGGIVKPLQGARSAFLQKGQVRGRRYILVDEWGPYDFKRPMMWQVPGSRKSINGMVSQSFEILGPKGNWRLDKISEGASVSKKRGSVPDYVVLSFPENASDISVACTYIGSETTDYRGVISVRGKSVPFGYFKMVTPIAWKVAHFHWDDATDPRTKPEEFRKLLKSTPVVSYSPSELSFATSGSPYDGVTSDRFATVADGLVSTQGGLYTLSVITDDGARVYVDGKLVIDEWHWQAPTHYERSLRLAKGSHRIRVEHFEIDGYTSLKVGLKKAK